MEVTGNPSNDQVHNSADDCLNSLGFKVETLEQEHKVTDFIISNLNSNFQETQRMNQQIFELLVNDFDAAKQLINKQFGKGIVQHELNEDSYTETAHFQAAI